MNLNLTLEEPLATCLRETAQARQQSPEQTANEIFRDALARLVREAAWQGSQRRRGELLRTARERSLSPAEQAELETLEAEVDQRLAPLDQRLLEMAEKMKREAEALPDAIGS